MASSTTCPSCGSTRNPTGATTCTACGKTLSTGIVLSSSGASLTATGGRKYPLSTTTPTLIGSRGCAILLSGAGIEAQHAKITPSGSGFAIEPVRGSVFVNGKTITSPTSLLSGANVKIGSQVLVYIGPASTVLTRWKPSSLIPAVPSKLKKVLPAVVSLAKPAISATKNLVVKTLKPDPDLEGRVIIVDGPYQESPDIEWDGLLWRILATITFLPIIIILFILQPSLITTFLVYGILRRDPKPTIPVRYLRVEDAIGKQFVVKMKGDLLWGMISMGDDAKFWGYWQAGNLTMRHAVNKTTNNAQVMLKTTLQKNILWGIYRVVILLVLVSFVVGLLSRH